MAKKATETKEITISPPNIQIAEFELEGTSPYVQHAFGQKARGVMKGKQEAGSKGKKGTKKEPKDFQACYEGAKHIAKGGWCGMPASAFRAALIGACRLVGFKMVHAKLGIFVQADGFDKNDATPLVKFTKGEPHYAEHMVRLATGVADVRARPMWDPGWRVLLRVEYDADMFSLDDVANLLLRVGRQVGIGEGRPGSPKSCGMGWGLFTIANKKDVTKK